MAYDIIQPYTPSGQRRPALPDPDTRTGQYARLPDGHSGSRWDFTSGTYETEKDAEAALDEALERSGCFRIYRQVEGYHLQPRLGQDRAGFRIDRLLLPLAPLTAAGWNHGAIGVECKRTYEKIGPPISQMLDYLRSAFYLHGSHVAVVPSYVFLFPYDGVGGTVQSIISQQHLGYVNILDSGAVSFSTGGSSSLGTVGPHLEQFTVNKVNHGKKAGTRG